MKKQFIAVAAAILLGSVVMAQAAPAAPQPPAGTQAQAPQVTKITGKLELIQGHIGLKSGGKTYYVARIGMLAGFIKDLQEGATVSLEGYERALPYADDLVFFMPTKLSLNGRDYDLGKPFAGKGPGGREFGGRGMMRGGRGMMGGGFGPGW
jgi:hypothetical protein